MKKTEYLKKINKNFYNKQALSFSKSRFYPWKGWFVLLPFIKKIPAKRINVLDLGCGNGRFLNFLASNNLNFKYTGWDISEKLINEAKEKYGKKEQANFEKRDILGKWGDIPKKDLIVLFGVSHHLNLKQLKRICKKVEKSLKKEGLFIISFWQIHKFKRFNKLVIKKQNKFLGENEFLLRWQNTNEERFYKIYNQEELKSIENSLTNFSLIHTFEKDGREKKLNKYLVFKKII